MPGKHTSHLSSRWLYLLISCAGLLFVGIIYGWSIIKIPLAQEFGWNSTQLALTYTITMCFFCLGSLAAGLLNKKIPPRILLLASAALIFCGYLFASRLSGKNIVTLYFSYGFITGSGIGISYNTLLSVGNSWFPDKKGTSSGILMMGFGLSTMFLGKLAAVMFDISSLGWRKTYLILGTAIAIVLVICSFLLRYPPEDTVFPKVKKKAVKDREKFEPRDYSAAETIRRPAFWLFYLYGTLSASVGSVVISFANELSLTLGSSAAAAATLVGILSIFNGLGRIVCGVAFDALGRRKTMLITSSVTLIAPILMMIALSVSSLPLGVFTLCLVGISYGSNPTISSAFISSFYGMKDFSLNYSIGNTKLLISSFTATIANSLLASTGSYMAPFMLLTVFATISFLLNFAIRKP